MSNKLELKMGDNTPEGVAFKLMKEITALEEPETAEKLLDIYAECLSTVTNPHARLNEKKK